MRKHVSVKVGANGFVSGRVCAQGTISKAAGVCVDQSWGTQGAAAPGAQFDDDLDELIPGAEARRKGRERHGHSRAVDKGDRRFRDQTNVDWRRH